MNLSRGTSNYLHFLDPPFVVQANTTERTLLGTRQKVSLGVEG